jgi:hypothetical protein
MVEGDDDRSRSEKIPRKMRKEKKRTALLLFVEAEERRLGVAAFYALRVCASSNLYVT